MVTIIKEGDSPEKIRRQLKKLRPTKVMDTKKYRGGVIRLNESPLKIQKRMRDEWE